jgi:hypothetical protein
MNAALPEPAAGTFCGRPNVMTESSFNYPQMLSSGTAGCELQQEWAICLEEKADKLALNAKTISTRNVP